MDRKINWHPRRFQAIWTALKKYGYLKSTLLNADLFNTVIAMLLTVQMISHKLDCLKNDGKQSIARVS